MILENLFKHNLDHNQPNLAQSTLGHRALKLGMQVCLDELSRCFFTLDDDMRIVQRLKYIDD